MAGMGRKTMNKAGLPNFICANVGLTPGTVVGLETMPVFRGRIVFLARAGGGADS